MPFRSLLLSRLRESRLFINMFLLEVSSVGYPGDPCLHATIEESKEFSSFPEVETIYEESSPVEEAAPSPTLEEKVARALEENKQKEQATGVLGAMVG